MRRVKQLVMLPCSRGLVDETVIVNMNGIAHLRGSPWTRFLCKDLQYHKQNTKQRKDRENHSVLGLSARMDLIRVKAPGRALLNSCQPESIVTGRPVPILYVRDRTS